MAKSITRGKEGHFTIAQESVIRDHNLSLCAPAMQLHAHKVELTDIGGAADRPPIPAGGFHHSQSLGEHRWKTGEPAEGSRKI